MSGADVTAAPNASVLSSGHAGEPPAHSASPSPQPPSPQSTSKPSAAKRPASAPIGGEAEAADGGRGAAARLEGMLEHDRAEGERKRPPVSSGMADVAPSEGRRAHDPEVGAGETR